MTEELIDKVKTEETVEIKQEEQEKRVPLRFELTDQHTDILRQHASALNSYYSGIGAQLCELIDNVKQVEAIRNNINQLQEDIAKELSIPRADRINWNLDKKFVEIVQ